MTWQPIDTAPRDGTPIFIWRHGWECAPIAWWGRYPEIVQDAEGNDTTMYGWILEKYFRFCPGFEEGFLGWDDDPMPTRWMPLPEEL